MPENYEDVVSLLNMLLNSAFFAVLPTLLRRIGRVEASMRTLAFVLTGPEDPDGRFETHVD